MRCEPTAIPCTSVPLVPAFRETLEHFELLMKETEMRTLTL